MLEKLVHLYRGAVIEHESAVAEEARVCAALGPDDPEAWPTPQSLVRYRRCAAAHTLGVYERALIFALNHKRDT